MANELTTTKEYSVQEITQIGQIFAKSGMYGIKSPEMAMTLMFQAQAEGIHPCKAMQEYHVINGKPSLSSQAMLARFQLAGGTAKWIKRTSTEATLYVSHKQGGELEVTWNIDRAKRAGLLGNPSWTKYPEAMLSARCISEAIRAVFPACLGGMYSIEEEEDIAFESEEKRHLKAQGKQEVNIDNEQAIPQDTHPQQPQATAKPKAAKKEIDEDTKQFMDGMKGLWTQAPEIYKSTMDEFGFKSANNVPPERRGEVFNTIVANITKAQQHQSAPTAEEQTDNGEVDNSLF